MERTAATGAGPVYVEQSNNDLCHEQRTGKHALQLGAHSFPADLVEQGLAHLLVVFAPNNH